MTNSEGYKGRPLRRLTDMVQTPDVPLLRTKTLITYKTNKSDTRGILYHIKLLTCLPFCAAVPHYANH